MRGVQACMNCFWFTFCTTAGVCDPGCCFLYILATMFLISVSIIECNVTSSSNILRKARATMPLFWGKYDRPGRAKSKSAPPICKHNRASSRLRSNLNMSANTAIQEEAKCETRARAQQHSVGISTGLTIQHIWRRAHSLYVDFVDYTFLGFQSK